jgi:hypothetical protein
MLIIDGVKYEEWIPEKEVEEFQPIVKEHVQDIFGNESEYIEARRLKSKAGIGSVPDGFVIIFSDSPQWHIVEVELSSHQLYDHIVNQVGRFINGIKNPVTQKNIIDTIYQEITGSKISKVEVEEAIGSGEIHKFLTDLISLPPILTIIIEKKTQELEEAINLLKYSPIKIVEFRTFTREGVELSVHAHLFEPLYQPPPKKIIITEVAKQEITPMQKGRKRVTAKDLIDANILKVGQIVYGWHHNTKYGGKVLNDGSIELLHTGEKYPSLNAAVYHVKGSEEDAWRWWLTTRENGSECVLDELRKEYRATHP